MRLNRRTSRGRGPGVRTAPEVVVLEPRPGTPPSAKPPVRIFVGTEPLQHRAERVLVWSVEQVRDPGRTYEIHLMKDLVGFDRRRWLTGFTNYRFAIPHLAGQAGRAIYNDVDQIYLADPAELFDADMRGQGFLALSWQDTAVMLIDCARMASVWPIEMVRSERRKAIEARARSSWGPLEPTWHARDWEYEPGGTRVLHFTTIHWQPWQPSPRHFVYHSTPAGHVWHELERAADRAGFQVFTATRPSAAYRAFVARAREGGRNGSHDAGRPASSASSTGDLETLLTAADARSVLVYTVGVAAAGSGALVENGRTVTRWDPTAPAAGEAPAGQFDAVVCPGGLERLPDEDVPWTIEALFARARSVLHVTLSEPPSASGEDGAGDEPRARGRDWWASHLAAASMRHPDVHCRVVFDQGPTGGAHRPCIREWGRRLAGPPRLWILGDDKAGHTTQSVGLADALGWPYELKRLEFNLLNRLSNRLLGGSRVSLTRRSAATLTPPWPDVAISTGRRTAPVARWIAKASGGHTRVVQLGRKGGEVVDDFDAVVTCAHFRLPLHQRRIETVAPLNAVTPARLAEAAHRWRDLFGDARRPHVALVVGGTSALHRLDTETAARMAREVRAVAEAAGGTVFAITSPRTGASAAAALEAGLTAPHRVHVWQRGEHDNPYLGHLALADVLVVTGESESMLAEAAATGTPLYIYPLPRRRPRPLDRVRGWVTEHAYARPRKKKGTIRPQQGLEYVCARLIERGIVHPLRDIEQLHDALVRRGVARRFGPQLERSPRSPLREMDEVAARIRTLVGVTDPPVGAHAVAPRADGSTAVHAS